MERVQQRTSQTLAKPAIESGMTTLRLSLFIKRKEMAKQNRNAEKFRALHFPGKPLVLFNAWDAGSAKAIAKSGAQAIATSSWAVADANGFADGEHVPLALAIDTLRRIVTGTDLTVTNEQEIGYGDSPDAVA